MNCGVSASLIFVSSRFWILLVANDLYLGLPNFLTITLYEVLLIFDSLVSSMVVNYVNFQFCTV